AKPHRVYGVEFAPAASVLIPAAALREVGGFDELFFLYREDDDLCRRLKKAGWKIGIAPSARVQHWHGLHQRGASWRYRFFLDYGDGILFLKYSKRSLPLAYLSLARHWFLRLASPSSFVIHAVAYCKCVRKFRRLNAHRSGNPFPFAVGRRDLNR